MNIETSNTFECEYCGYFKGDAELHEMSVTHAVNKRNKLKQLEPSLTGDEANEVCKSIWNCDDIIKDLECGNSVNMGGTCEYEPRNLQDLIEHEKTCCYGEMVIRKPTTNVTKKKIYSSVKAVCDTCGKVYLHTSRNITPINSLRRHKKTCEQNLGRNLRGELQNYIKSLSVVDLKKTLDFIKTI